MASDAQRHKRTFDEMSQQSNLPPSPVHIGGFARSLASSFLSRNSPSENPSERRLSNPQNNNPPPIFSRSPSLNSLSERRRLSHPHNPRRLFPEGTPEFFPGSTDNMPPRNQQQRPHLQHQASRTLTIDLTDDQDEAPTPQRAARMRAGGSQRDSQGPPRLGRSDAQALGGVIIDLTNDDPDVLITASRQRIPVPVNPPRERRPQAQINPPIQRPRNDSPLFVPRDASPHGDQNQFHRLFLGVQNMADRHPEIRNQMYGAAHFIMGVHVQAMPGQMDYQRQAFEERRPDHVAPPPAKAGFTRSPTEADVVICPSCEEELIHNKEVEDEPMVKKGGKAPSKKEREEHPFWVVKECGHVYCNKCYQNRVPSKISTHKASFVEKAGAGRSKKLLCAVEECAVDIKNKEKWVGVFL